MCQNTVSQTVPTRYSAKVVYLRCGSTGIDGSPLYCEACQRQGYVARPAWTYEDAGEEDYNPPDDNWTSLGYR